MIDINAEISKINNRLHILILFFVIAFPIFIIGVNDNNLNLSWIILFSLFLCMLVFVIIILFNKLSYHENLLTLEKQCKKKF